MAKIYVSSTFLDFQGFREKILLHLHRLQQSVGALRDHAKYDPTPWLRDRARELIREIGVHLTDD